MINLLVIKVRCVNITIQINQKLSSVKFRFPGTKEEKNIYGWPTFEMVSQFITLEIKHSFMMSLKLKIFNYKLFFRVIELTQVLIDHPLPMHVVQLVFPCSGINQIFYSAEKLTH